VIDEGVDRRCWLCKRHRTTGFVLVQTLPCCGEVLSVCAEKCAEMIPRVCRGMTVERYVEKFAAMHAVMCKKGRSADERRGTPGDEDPQPGGADGGQGSA
jgi:hypothetical protein